MHQLARVAVPFLTACTLMSGCFFNPGYRPGGSQASRDLYTYPSTMNAPQSVALMNPATSERIWEIDIPIGSQLVIAFYDTQDTGDPNNPSVMRWALMDLGEESGSLPNALPVPGPMARLLVPTLRPSPASYPGEVVEPMTIPTPPFLPAEPVTEQ